MSLQFIKADYANQQHAEALVHLLNIYASEPMGGGGALTLDVKTNLVAELAKRPFAFSILAFDNETPVGLINCFEAFSTFSCKPLINVHDIIVLEAYRGQGIAPKMLQKVEAIAIDKGCCKITLEVLSNNNPAKSSYKKCGFSDYQLDPEAGTALFWQKKL